MKFLNLTDEFGIAVSINPNHIQSFTAYQGVTNSHINSVIHMYKRDIFVRESTEIIRKLLISLQKQD